VAEGRAGCGRLLSMRGKCGRWLSLGLVVTVLLPTPVWAAPPRPAFTRETICQMIDAVLGKPLPRARRAIKDLDCAKKAYRSGRLVVRAILISSDRAADRRLALAPGRTCRARYRSSDPGWGDHWFMGLHLFHSTTDPRIRYSVDLEQLASADTDSASATGAQCGASADGYLIQVDKVWMQEGTAPGVSQPLGTKS
jgi:hypothetical protein